MSTSACRTCKPLDLLAAAPGRRALQAYAENLGRAAAGRAGRGLSQYSSPRALARVKLNGAGAHVGCTRAAAARPIKTLQILHDAAGAGRVSFGVGPVKLRWKLLGVTRFRTCSNRIKQETTAVFVQPAAWSKMGLCFPCAAASAPADDTLPSSLHKGAPKVEHIESLLKSTAPEAAEGVEDPKPAPSVVISWVLHLNDVANSGIPQKLLVTEENCLKRDVQTEAHAARLRKCWEKHGDVFPKAFATEVSRFWQSLSDEDFKGLVAGDKVTQIATFLAQIFASVNASMHVTRRSLELWPSVLEELRRKLEEMSKGAEWAAPENKRWRGRTQILLQSVIVNLPKEPLNSAKNITFTTENHRNIAKAFDGLLEEMSAMEVKAYELQQEAEKEAKKEVFRASLNKAPWEIETKEAA